MYGDLKLVFGSGRAFESSSICSEMELGSEGSLLREIS